MESSLNKEAEEDEKQDVSQWDSPDNMPEQKLKNDIKPEIAYQNEIKQAEE